MSPRRLVLLLGGILMLVGLSLWRLSRPSPAWTPPKPTFDSGKQQRRESPASQSALQEFHGATMGTTYSVKYFTEAPVSLALARAAVQGALDEVNAVMSTYLERSEVSTFNRQKAYTAMPLSPALFEVMELSAQIYEKTTGAFDVTVGPLVAAYGFGAGARSRVPRQSALEAMRARIGMKLLVLDPGTRSLSKTVDGVELDLSAIAKGYGVDQAARALERIDVASYMIEVGGEIRVRGLKPDGQSWALAIEEPRLEGRALHGILKLSERGAALATSGDYRNHRTHGTETFSHTIDPRSGEPTPRRTASVSVVRDSSVVQNSAAEADALATALSVMDPDQALELADREGWAVYMLVHRGTGGFQARSSLAFSALDFEQLPTP